MGAMLYYKGALFYYKGALFLQLLPPQCPHGQGRELLGQKRTDVDRGGREGCWNWQKCGDIFLG